jgi:hypothetical protein
MRQDRGHNIPPAIQKSMTLAEIIGREFDEMTELLRAGLAVAQSSGQEFPRIPAEQVRDTLERWVGLAKGLPDFRRAAALLAADQILEIVQYASPISDASAGAGAREALMKIGAEFRKAPLEVPKIIYINSWLWEAYRLDADGPVGGLSFLELMNRGFDTTRTCSAGSDSFRTVIQRGEEYLTEPRDPEVRQAVELMVAEAYLDIVALAAGAGWMFNTDPEPYKGSAPEARVMAIRHFRAGLMKASDSREVRTAWSKAWRTLAGIPPRGPRFYCWND